MNLVYMLDAPWTTNHTDEHIGGATEMLAAAEEAGNMEIVGMAYGWRLCMHLEFDDVRAAETDQQALTRVDARIGQQTHACLSCHAQPDAGRAGRGRASHRGVDEAPAP